MSEHAECPPSACAVEPHRRQRGNLAHVLALCHEKQRLHCTIEIFFGSILTDARAPKRRGDLGREVTLLGNLAIQVAEKV